MPGRPGSRPAEARRRRNRRRPHRGRTPLAGTYAAVTLRLWLAVLLTGQVALAGVPDQVAFQRAYLLVPFLAWVPNLLVAERYLAVGTRFPRTRRGTLSP